MPNYHIITEGSDGSEGHCSTMTRDRAFALAYGLLMLGLRVTRIEATDVSEVLDKDQVKALCETEKAAVQRGEEASARRV